KTQTDGRGRFRVSVPGHWLKLSYNLRQELGLIAHKPGLRVAVIGFTGASVPPPAGARLVLGPPVTTALKVLAPDRRPVAGARVEVTGLICEKVQTDISAQYARDSADQFRWKARETPLGFVIGRTVAALPEELSRRLTAQTDAAGNVSLKDLASADTGSIAVTAAAFGTQVGSLYLYMPKESIVGFP